MGGASSNSSEHGGNGDRLNESLSALMDGEANELELHRVLDQLGESPELREKAISYQRIGAAIRREPSDFAGIDLSGAIRDALADEPVPEADKPAAESGAKSGWFTNLGRFAVAASVALVTIVGVQSWQLSNSGGSLDLAGNLPVDPAPVVMPADSVAATANSSNFGVLGIQAGLGTEQTGMTPEQLSRAQGYADQVAQTRFRAYMLERRKLLSLWG